MYALAELIKANGDELAELESLDNGKPLAAAKGDIAASVDHLRYYAGWPTKIEGETIPVSGRDLLCYTLREPVGVCAQIVPWNFPLLMAVWKVAPALAAGCPIDPEARRADAADRAAPRRAGARGGLPRGHAQRAHRRRRDRRRARRPPRRRQGRLHRLDRGRPRDRRQVRARAEAGDARARRQEPEHHPSRRRPRRARSRAPSRASTSTPARPATPARGCSSRRELFDEVVERLAEFAARGQGRPRARPRTRSSARWSPRSSSSGSPATSTPGSRRAPRRSPAGCPRTATAATSSTRPCSPGVADEMQIAREEIFGPVLVAQPFEDLEEVAAARQRHRVRPRRRPLDPRHLQRPQARRAAQGRLGLHQHLGRRRPGGPVRRLQGVGDRPREGPPQPRRLPRDEDGLHPAVGGLRRGRSSCTSPKRSATRIVPSGSK